MTDQLHHEADVAPDKPLIEEALSWIDRRYFSDPASFLVTKGPHGMRVWILRYGHWHTASLDAQTLEIATHIAVFRPSEVAVVVATPFFESPDDPTYRRVVDLWHFTREGATYYRDDGLPTKSDGPSVSIPAELQSDTGEPQLDPITIRSIDLGFRLADSLMNNVDLKVVRHSVDQAIFSGQPGLALNAFRPIADQAANRWAMAIAAQTPPPEIVEGWYPDPGNRLKQRFWDGEQWTASWRPVPPGPIGTPVGPPSPAQWAEDGDEPNPPGDKRRFRLWRR